MSNFLFQNISAVFAAPQEVMDIIGKFEAVKKDEALANDVREAGKGLSLDENGEVDIDEELVGDKAADLFGRKIYGRAPDVKAAVKDAAGGDGSPEVRERLKEAVKKPFSTI